MSYEIIENFDFKLYYLQQKVQAIFELKKKTKK